MSTTVKGVRGGRWVRRLGLAGALTGLLVGLVAVAGPGAAQAHHVTCREFTEGKVPLRDGHTISNGWLYVVDVLLREPTFFKGGGRTLQNESDATQPETATTSVSMTRTTQEVTQAGATRTIIRDVLNTTGMFSRTITESVTVSTTVSKTYNVPPRSALQADFGVFGFNVLLNLEVWEIAGGRCWFYPQRSPSGIWVSATADAGWRDLTYPRINPGGIVNASDWSFTMHPGTIVAIFGKDFLPPGDRLFVRQGTREWSIQSGSPWWFDSLNQINAALPGDLQPGIATVTVLAPNGLESLEPRQIIIS